MDHRARTSRQLFSDVAALQPCRYVKAVRSHDAGYLLDGNICVSPKIRNVSGVLLVRENQPYHVPMSLEYIAYPSNAGLEFFEGGHVFTVECRCALKDS